MHECEQRLVHLVLVTYAPNRTRPAAYCRDGGAETYTNGSLTETTKTLPACLSLGELM